MMSLIEDYIAVYDRDVSALSVTNFIRDWISNHEDLVCQWLPDGAIEKPTLYIGGFFPLWVESVYREPSLVTGEYLHYILCYMMYIVMISMMGPSATNLFLVSTLDSGYQL